MKLSAQRRPSLLLTQLLGSGPQGTKERCQVPGPTRDLLAHCYGSGRGGTGVLSGPEADGAAQPDLLAPLSSRGMGTNHK